MGRECSDSLAKRAIESGHFTGQKPGPTTFPNACLTKAPVVFKLIKEQMRFFPKTISSPVAVLSRTKLSSTASGELWPRRDLNTQPSDLESDALPLRHKVCSPLAFYCYVQMVHNAVTIFDTRVSGSAHFTGQKPGPTTFPKACLTKAPVIFKLMKEEISLFHRGSLALWLF